MQQVAKSLRKNKANCDEKKKSQAVAQVVEILSCMQGSHAQVLIFAASSIHVGPAVLKYSTRKDFLQRVGDYISYFVSPYVKCSFLLWM